jgi:hypothetical protein
MRLLRSCSSDQKKTIADQDVHEKPTGSAVVS